MPVARQRDGGRSPVIVALSVCQATDSKCAEYPGKRLAIPQPEQIDKDRDASFRSFLSSPDRELFGARWIRLVGFSWSTLILVAVQGVPPAA